MRLHQCLLLCLIVFGTTFSLPVVSQSNDFCDGFCLIENFDDRLNGSIGDQGEWQSNPPGSLDGAIVTDSPPSPLSGKALMIDPRGVQFRGNAYLPLGDMAIRDGSTGTLFFQIYAEDLNDTYSHFGLTDLANPRLTDEGSGQIALYTDFEAQFILNRGVFSVKHGEQTISLTNISASSATLYNIWMVVNNFTDTYEIYVQGGSHSTVTKGVSNGRDTFDFRNGLATADLQTIYSITSPGVVLESKRYIDNLYVDPDQENLSNPVSNVPGKKEFSEIATFDSLETGAIDGRDGWSSDTSSIVFDPLDTTNKVLRVSSKNVSKRFSGVPDQGEGTLFFRMMRNGLVNASAGLSDVATPTVYADFENQVNVQNTSTLNVRHGGQFQAVDTFEADVWYCVWMTTDNSSDRYEVYMKGGVLPEPTRLTAGSLSIFSYRFGSDAPLSTFFAKMEPSDGDFFIDDIYYSSTRPNLKSPDRNNCSTTNTPKLLVDPIPETISKSGLSAVLEEFATIPSSNGNATPQARINFLDHANDNSGRLFVNDLRNKLYVIQSNGDINEYLDLESVFTDFVDSPGLGSGFGFFAFHPEFSSNGKFYTVHTEAGDALSEKIPDYSSNSTDAVQGVLTEWTAMAPEANQFSGLKREVLRIGFTAYLHGFQQIGFNPTAQPGSSDYGLLYIATGDGQQNPYFTDSPQDLLLPHGKILRIDPLSINPANGRYGIPYSNPFVDTSGALGEIWAYGLRNPHRFSWDSGGTNQMYIGHIGEKNIDAIYPGLAGANYGWTEREGSFLFKIDDPNNVYSLPADDAQHGYTYPVAQYDHDEGFAVVGGFVYRGANIPELNGKYIFGDVVNGRIFYTEEANMVAGEPPTTIHELTLFDSSGNERSMAEFAGNSRVDLRMGMDASGELYFLSKTNGKIWRLTAKPTLNNAPVLSSIDNQNSTIGDDIYLAIAATDNDGDTLQFDVTGLPNGLIVSIDGEISGSPTTIGSFDVTVVVSDTHGATDTEAFEWTIEALNDTTKPTGSITSPVSNSTVSPSASATIQGTATDDSSGVKFVRVLIERISVQPREYWNGTSWQTSRQGTYRPTVLSGDNWTLANIDLSQPGEYRVRLYVGDYAGNRSSAALNVIEFTVPPLDTTKPTGSITSPVTNSTVNTHASFTIEGTATDDSSGVSFIRARVERISVLPREYWNGTSWQTSAKGTFLLATLNGNTWTLTDIDLSEPGEYRLRFYARDNAGNQSSTALNVIEFQSAAVTFNDGIAVRHEGDIAQDKGITSLVNLVTNDSGILNGDNDVAGTDVSDHSNGGSVGWMLLCILTILLYVRSGLVLAPAKHKTV